MNASITSVAMTATAGALSWTAVEYGLHRFGMHELRGKGLASREHLKHHADVSYFASTAKKALSAVTTAAVTLPVASFVAGPAHGAVFTTGLIGMYLTYELIHRRIHTHAPINGYGRWLRRSHLYHHFGGPMRNFGVTTPVWDQLFRSYDQPGVITVPRRHAPVWLIDASGMVKPEFADDYVVKGGSKDRVSLADIERDRLDAFANRLPTVDIVEEVAAVS